MVKKLASLGLATHRPYHGVQLTPAGAKVALEVIRHHRLLELFLARSSACWTVVALLVALADLVFVVAVWKELKATSFDPGFSRSVGIPPQWLGRGLLTMVAVTAVCAFESVGAILVVTLFIVPAATAFLLTDRLVAMVAISVGIGWLAAGGGYAGALAVDGSIAGMMGLVAGLCFAVALAFAPRHGVLARRRHRRRARARAGLPATAG